MKRKYTQTLAWLLITAMTLNNASVSFAAGSDTSSGARSASSSEISKDESEDEDEKEPESSTEESVSPRNVAKRATQIDNGGAYGFQN